MRPRFLAAFLALAALALSGCGSPELWARYRAERQFWQARRRIERIQINPRVAGRREFEAAIAAFRRIVDDFPPVWAAPGRMGDRRARDVATLSGDALLAVGRLEEGRGNATRAMEVYRQAESSFQALPAVRLRALLATAGLSERTGSIPAATAIYAQITRDFPPVEPESGDLVRPVLDAPLRVAADLKERGLARAADSVLAAADSRFAAEAERRHGQPAAPELWARVGRVRAARGRPEELTAALDAMRRALAEPAPKPMRASLVLAMAGYCREAHRPDSALAYSAWAARDFGRETRGQAMMLEGRIWEGVSVDSAVAAYARFIDAFAAGDSVLAARFRRAELLEQEGRWEQARSEYRAVANSSATDEFALEASERIVAHHVKRGEKELARIEGRHALESLDRLVVTVQDEEALMRIRQARARVLLSIEEWDDAYAALIELWSRYGHLGLGVSAGFRAAGIAEQELHDRVRAQRLYEDLAARGGSLTNRKEARRQLERLRQAGG